MAIFLSYQDSIDEVIILFLLQSNLNKDFCIKCIYDIYIYIYIYIYQAIGLMSRVEKSSELSSALPYTLE